LFLNNLPATSDVRILTLFLIALVIFACQSRKNTDYVIITTEARRLQSALREAKSGQGINTKELLRNASYDGTKRWELSGDENFLFRSAKKHSIKAISSEKSYYYIRRNGDVVMKNE